MVLGLFPSLAGYRRGWLRGEPPDAELLADMRAALHAEISRALATRQLVSRDAALARLRATPSGSEEMVRALEHALTLRVEVSPP